MKSCHMESTHFPILTYSMSCALPLLVYTHSLGAIIARKVELDILRVEK